MSYANLYIFAPDPEDWSVYRVWWGRKESMAGDLDGVAGVNLYSAVHPVSLFVVRP